MTAFPKFTYVRSKALLKAVASGRELFQAQMAGQITPEYRALLIKVFGEEKMLEGHERVKRWINTKEL